MDTTSVKNLQIANNKIEFDFQGERYSLKRSQVHPQIKLLLSEFYRQELRGIEQEHQLSLKGSVLLLIDLYYLKTPEILELLLTLILKRLEKGINHSMAIRLKHIYIALGHFLKKYRYI